MDKHTQHITRVAALGGAPVGRAPGQQAVDGMSADGEQDGSMSVRSPPNWSERLISIKEVRLIIGSPSVSSIYRWIDAGKFPRPLKISDKRVAWRLSDIQNWIASKTGVGTVT